MNIYRYEKDGKLYTLREVQPAASKLTGYYLQAEPYGHLGVPLGTPNGRGRIKQEDFTLVGER